MTTRARKLHIKRLELESVEEAIEFLKMRRGKVTTQLHEEVRRATLLRREIELLERRSDGQGSQLDGRLAG